MMQVMDEDGTWRDSNISAWSVLGRCFAAFLALVGCGMAYHAYRRGAIGLFSADDLLLFVLAGFAATGFFCLVCFSLGICRFSMGDPLKIPVAKLFNQMPSAIVITDNSGTIRYMNASYRRLDVKGNQTPQALLLRDEKAASGVHRLSLAAREGRQTYEELHLATPLGLSGERKTEQATGEHDFYTYAVHISPMEVDGETLSIWSIADFTHLRNRQETLFEDLQEAVYHLDHAPAGFLSWNERGRLVYLNATLAGWLGLDLAGGTPDNLELEQLFGSQNAAELCNATLPSAQEEPKPLLLDMQMVHGRVSLHCYLGAEDKMQNGLRRALLIPPRTKEIKQEVLPTATTDVAAAPIPTENAQNEVKDSTHFLHFLDASPIAMAVMDQEGVIHHANARFVSLLEQESDSDQEQTSPTVESLVHPRDRQRIVQACMRAFSGQDIPHIDTTAAADVKKTEDMGEAENEGKNRHIRLFFSADTQIFRHFSYPVVLVGAVEITDQRILEQQLEQGQKMQAVGQLAGGIAHDFNNVLTAIIMSCDLLLSSHRSSDPSHPDIMNIKNNAGRAAALVRQLLAFSRRQTLRPQVLDLTDMLADSRLLLARLVGMSVGLKIEHGRDLWPVMADQAELERVIINLATNAHDAMPEGGLLTIRTANIARDEVASLNHPELEEKDYVLIEVKDSGSGIAPEIREKIFEPFFTTKEVGKGTGLGLSMVYGIVAQTGGAIYCHSEPGEGACFSIYLPRHVGDEFEASQDNTTADEEATKAPLVSSPSLLVDLSGTATILVVEDEDAVRLGSVKALQSRGYRVLEATTGAQALKIVAEHNGKVDLVVSDVVMPEMDGPTLLKELRFSYPDIKFIFVSGYAEDAFAKNLPADAQFAFLPKPFSLKQLATIVKTSLSS